MTKTAALWCLLLLATVIAGCAMPSTEPPRSRGDETALVRTTVTDPVRAERLLALIDERDRLVAETGKLLDRYRLEMKAINADYDADPGVVVEMIDYYNRERARKQLAFIDLISKMKRATTSSEWAVIADFQLRNFDPRKLIYQKLEGG